MTYTDTQLKQALAKLAPQLVKLERCIPSGVHLYWLGQEPPLTCSLVLDTELLHLCWLVDRGLSDQERLGYNSELLEYGRSKDNGRFALNGGFNAPWQQRVTALAKVKGVEIV